MSHVWSEHGLIMQCLILIHGHEHFDLKFSWYNENNTTLGTQKYYIGYVIDVQPDI